jgi:hypothetical protein
MISKLARSVLVCALLARICSLSVAKGAVEVIKEVAQLLVSRRLLQNNSRRPLSLIKVEPLQRKTLTTMTMTFRFKIRKAGKTLF